MPPAIKKKSKRTKKVEAPPQVLQVPLRANVPLRLAWTHTDIGDPVRELDDVLRRPDRVILFRALHWRDGETKPWRHTWILTYQQVLCLLGREIHEGRIQVAVISKPRGSQECATAMMNHRSFLNMIENKKKEKEAAGVLATLNS